MHWENTVEATAKKNKKPKIFRLRRKELSFEKKKWIRSSKEPKKK